MLVKEFLQLFRDPQMLRILILPPLLQILLFGYAVTTNVRNAPTVVVDPDRPPPPRPLSASSPRGISACPGNGGLPGGRELMNRGDAG
jgi:hypothetical protein